MQAAPKLSIVRPGVLPFEAPTGKAAREIKWEAFTVHPGYNATPGSILAAYAMAEQGYPQTQCDLFDDRIEIDCHLRNLFEQREQAVSGKPMVVAHDGTTGDSELAAEVLSWAVSGLLMDGARHQLKFNRHGFACGEIDWDIRYYQGRPYTVPVWLADVPPRRFAIDPLTDELRLLTEAERTKGESLAPAKWWITRRERNRVARSGLMRTATWPSLWKSQATRDWVIRCEKYGLPLLLVKYGELSDDQAKDVAHEIIARFGDDGGAAVPDKINVEVKDSSAADSSGTHGGMIAHANRELSKLINGSTLANDSSDAGGASYALGDIHNEVRWEAVVWDALMLHRSFATCIAEPFLRFNRFATDTKAPVLQIQVVRDLDPTDLVGLAEKLRGLGVAVSVSQLRLLTGLRAPDNLADTAGYVPPAPTTPAPAPAPAPEVSP